MRPNPQPLPYEGRGEDSPLLVYFSELKNKVGEGAGGEVLYTL